MSDDFLPFDETAFDSGRVLVAEHGFRLANNARQCRNERMPMASRSYPLRSGAAAIKARRVCTASPAWLGPWVIPSAVERTIRVMGSCSVERGDVSITLVNRTTGVSSVRQDLGATDQTFDLSVACIRGENILWLKVECEEIEDTEYIASDVLDVWSTIQPLLLLGMMPNGSEFTSIVPPTQVSLSAPVDGFTEIPQTSAPEFAIRVTVDNGDEALFTVSDIVARDDRTLLSQTPSVRANHFVLWEEPSEGLPVDLLRYRDTVLLTSNGLTFDLVGLSAIEIHSLHFEQTTGITIDQIGFGADTHFAQRPSATTFGARALTTRGLHRARFPFVGLGAGVPAFAPVARTVLGHTAIHYVERVNVQPSGAIQLIYRCTAQLLRDLYPPGTDGADDVRLSVALPIAAFRRFRDETVSRYRAKIVNLTDTFATGDPVALNAETTPNSNVSQYAPTSPRLFRMAARATISGCWSITAQQDLDRWGVLRATTGPLVRGSSALLADDAYFGVSVERVDADGNPEPTNRFDFIALGEPTWWISESL